MFEVGWTEMLVIAVVMIVVVGPKDLPRMLRTFGRTTAKLRSMAGDFQKQFNEALREAELDDVKKSVDELRKLNPATEIRKQLNPFEKAAADVRAGLDAAMKPSAPKPADPAVHAAEPLKGGSAAVPPAEPIVAGPTEMPKPPVLGSNAGEPASPAVHPAEPLKNGATVMPGEGRAEPKAKAPAKAAKTPAPAPAKTAAVKSAAAAKPAATNKAAPAKTVAAAKPAPRKKPADKTS